MVKICPVCGLEFETANSRKVYCSSMCCGRACRDGIVKQQRIALIEQTTRPCDECEREKQCSGYCDKYRAWFGNVWARMREDARPALVAVQKKREEAQQGGA